RGGAWQARERAGHGPLEREFLAARRDRAERERAAARRRTRLILAGLAVALAGISAVAALAIVRGNEAANQRDLARSRQIAASADSQLSVDPELGVLLGEQAYSISPTRQAEEALRQATFDSRVRAALHG